MNITQLEQTMEAMDSMVARCGHNDPMGYLTGTVCGKCARRNHRQAIRGTRQGAGRGRR